MSSSCSSVLCRCAVVAIAIGFQICLLFGFGTSTPSHLNKISQLPGQPTVGFQQFSGYVHVDHTKQKALFYYFVEAQVDPSSKPLVLWLNGGHLGFVLLIMCRALHSPTCKADGGIQPKEEIIQFEGNCIFRILGVLQVGGWTEVYGDILSFATIRGASHEAPFSQPQRSLVLFKSFLQGSPLPQLTRKYAEVGDDGESAKARGSGHLSLSAGYSSFLDLCELLLESLFHFCKSRVCAVLLSVYMRKSQIGRGRGSEEDEDANREFDVGSDEPETPLPLTSRVRFMLVDLKQWLELVRKRTRSSLRSLDPMPSSAGESYPDSDSLPSDQATRISLWDRLGGAALLDVEPNSFSWSMLSSLHHTQHSGSTDQSDDESSKALEVTVNSGGVVFFALFNKHQNDDPSLNEAAAVIKISSSRIATQSERLGYEFAKWLGVRSPQARVIHNTSPEWLQIKEAAENARAAATSENDEVGEMTCSELLEALELSRCIFLMNYVHGSPLMENANAFDSKAAAEKIASALGRILVLDLVIRNEDRLCCRQLGWRGNSANLLLADKSASANMDKLGEACDSAVGQYRPSVLRALQKDRRTTSITALESQKPDMSDASEPLSKMNLKDGSTNSTVASDIHIVAIDSGVPRRPPAGKRASDQENYPKLVELILNSSTYSSNLLHEITGGKLGASSEAGASNNALSATDMALAVAFRNGFRAALRDLQGFQIFLLTLHQKLDTLLRSFLNIINKTSTGEADKEELVVPESPVNFGNYCASPTPREHYMNDNNADANMDVVKTTAKQSSSSGSTSPTSREGWHGKFSKGGAEPPRSLRLTTRLRDLHKYAKVDAELSKELDQWNEMFRNDAVKLCQDNNFNTGFFEGSDNNTSIDAYELKVRLEHILERISLISDAANTEKPSLVTSSLFIGGALAARSVHTLQHIGITHILCLCANEIGQSESQRPDLFEYKSFSIYDEEDSNISSIFEDGCDFIDHVEQAGGKVLVHCFEGRSRSATMVLAYLMLRKKLTLLEAWNKLKKVHRRAQPNDGFARILLELDKKLHGKASMEWQQRKPTMKVCPICGKTAGLSSSSLKLHLQKSHKRLSSGSVDSAMTLEIEKAMTALKVSHGGNVSPTPRDASLLD